MWENCGKLRCRKPNPPKAQGATPSAQGTHGAPTRGGGGGAGKRQWRMDCEKLQNCEMLRPATPPLPCQVVWGGVGCVSVNRLSTPAFGGPLANLLVPIGVGLGGWWGGVARGHGVDLSAFGSAYWLVHILTLCGPERGLVVSTEPPDDLSCLTTPGGGGGGVPETSCCPCHGPGALGRNHGPWCLHPTLGPALGRNHHSHSISSGVRRNML